MTQNEVHININHNVLSRAQGCLLGQLAGDALGSPGGVPDTRADSLEIS